MIWLQLNIHTYTLVYTLDMIVSKLSIDVRWLYKQLNVMMLTEHQLNE